MASGGGYSVMTLFQAFGQFASAGVALDDFRLITSQTFTSVSSVSFDDCFSADYDHYLIANKMISGADTAAVMRLRAGGSSDSSTNYSRQEFYSNGSGETETRITGETSYGAGLGYLDTSLYNATLTFVSYPFASIDTSFYTACSEGVDDIPNWLNIHQIGWHNVASSYDGFEVPFTTTVTGSIHVYGWAV